MRNHCLDIDIPVIRAPKISKDSWLNDPEYASFVAGYEYATTQTRAIHGLSKVSPEEAYFIYETIKRGIDVSPAKFPLYTVQYERYFKTDKYIHWARHDVETLCGQSISDKWFILTNDGKSAANCKECLKIYNEVSRNQEGELSNHEKFGN